MGQPVCRGLQPMSVEKGILVADVLVIGYNAAEVANSPLWPQIHIDGRSSMARLDQSGSHAELWYLYA